MSTPAIIFGRGISFRPRVGPCDSVELGPASNERSATLVRRGTRNGWEPFLGVSGRSVRLGPSYGLPLGENACVCVRPPFRARGTTRPKPAGHAPCADPQPPR